MEPPVTYCPVLGGFWPIDPVSNPFFQSGGRSLRRIFLRGARSEKKKRRAMGLDPRPQRKKPTQGTLF
jgi:hypothetical protein